MCFTIFIKKKSKNSYEDDETELFSRFLNSLTTNLAYDEVFPTEVKAPLLTLCNSEFNSLYHISGYILKSIVNTSELSDLFNFCRFDKVDTINSKKIKASSLRHSSKSVDTNLFKKIYMQWFSGMNREFNNKFSSLSPNSLSIYRKITLCFLPIVFLR